MPKGGFNVIERVESFGIDFAFYRGLDPVLERWFEAFYRNILKAKARLNLARCPIYRNVALRHFYLKTTADPIGHNNNGYALMALQIHLE